MYPTVLYDDARAAIRTLTEGFGFTEEAVYEGENGSCAACRAGAAATAAVMLGSKGGRACSPGRWPVRARRGCTWWWSGVDAALRPRPPEFGVEILMEPTDQDYGSRDYMARDAEGNVWSFGTYAPGSAG
ncbi:VOC domain-containing protein OS=Streptomyces microflavus OX=1919 GN=Smic_15520 PE=4 SV=1 [Streptomyces microflavus]